MKRKFHHLSEEHKQNISKALRMEKVRKKLSEANKGKIIPQEVREKISRTMTGRKLTKEHIEHLITPERNKKISETMKKLIREGKRKIPPKNIQPEHLKEVCFKKGHKAWNKGQHIQTNSGRTHFKKNDERLLRENNQNYRGGKLEIDIDYLNQKKRQIVLERDNFTCQKCHKKSPEVKLITHHKVSYRLKKSNSPDDMITLCRSCHNKIEYETTKMVFSHG